MKKILFTLLTVFAISASAATVSTNNYRTVVTDGGTNIYWIAADGVTTNLLFNSRQLLKWNTTNVTYSTNLSVIAYEDMLQSANSAVRSGVSDISADDALGGQSFAATATTAAANDHLTFTYQIPHRRKNETPIEPHVHFWQSNADQTNFRQRIKAYHLSSGSSCIVMAQSELAESPSPILTSIIRLMGLEAIRN